MSYQQEIHGMDHRGLATPVDELMDEAERKKQLYDEEVWKALKLAEAAHRHGDPAPSDSAEEIKRRLNEYQALSRIQRAKEAVALAEGVEMDGPPDPVYSEAEKVQRAQESWEYNKSQGLTGEIPPDWHKNEDPQRPLRFSDLPEYPPIKQWGQVTVRRPSDAAVEDEALRRRVREGLSWLEYVPAFLSLYKDLMELLGRYEALFALVEVYANNSPVDGNGVYVSRRPQENKPGTDHL